MTAQNLAYLNLQIALNNYQQAPANLTTSQRAQVKQQAQQQYQLEIRILSSPEAQSIHITPQQISSALADIQQRYATQEEFTQDLHNNGIEIEQFPAILARQLKVDAILDSIAQHIAPITDLEADTYYQQHPSRFQRPETRIARHILISINPDFPENTRQTAYQRLSELAALLHKKPHLFAEQARRHSECVTTLEGGLLGPIQPGQLYPELDNALFSLEENQISAVLESPLGFHLLWCEKIQPAVLIPFAEAKPKILAHLQQKRIALHQKNWIRQLSNSPVPA